jgi:Tfp pilus assembly protein PilF
MIVRCVKSAFVSAALLAAIAMSSGTAYANSPSADTELVRAAYQNLKHGDARAAVVQFTKAIDAGQLEPEILANALLNRALAYQQLGGHEQAVSDYTAALALAVMARPLQATALYNRGLS